MKNNGKYGYNNVFTEVNVVGENSWYDNNNVCTEVNFVSENSIKTTESMVCNRNKCGYIQRGLTDYRGPSFFRSKDSTPRPPPYPPSPARNLPLFLSLPVCRMSTLLTRGGGGYGRGAESYDRKKAWASINYAILSGYIACFAMDMFISLGRCAFLNISCIL